MAKVGKRKKAHSKKRRVGGLGLKGGTGLKLLTVAAGYFLADTINPMIDKVNPITKTDPVSGAKIPDQTVATVAQVGIGGMLLLKKKSSGTLGTVLMAGGGVLAGAGLKRALKMMGVIKGYQSVPVIGNRRVAGYQSVPVIGRTIPPQLAGTPGQLQGYVNQGSGVGSYINQGSGAPMGSQMMANANGSGIMNGSGYLG